MNLKAVLHWDKKKNWKSPYHWRRFKKITSKKKKTFIKTKKVKRKTSKKYKLTSTNLNYKKNCPVSLEEAYQFAKDLYQIIVKILKILLICSVRCAVVQRDFSLMNMQMNKLRSSMKIRTLDSLMRIYYEYDITDQDADNIIKVWFKNVNRRIDLPWCPSKYPLKLSAWSSETALLFILTFML